VLDGEGEGIVEAASLKGKLCVAGKDEDFDACGGEFGEAAPADERVGVDSGDDAAGYAGGDEGIGARAGTAVVGAGLKGDAGGCAVKVMAGGVCVFQGNDFGVVADVVVMGAFGEHGFTAQQNAANGGIRRGEGLGVASEL
jgi:hypothetical protein